MDFLELAYEAGLEPKKIASTNGGEYQAACPLCGGTKRFRMWPNAKTAHEFPGRYWCRECDLKGDAIQFCRDVWGLNYQNACQKLCLRMKDFSQNSIPIQKMEEFKRAEDPSPIWQTKASLFVDWSHQQLIKRQEMIQILLKRGLMVGTIIKFKLGYSLCHGPFKDFWRDREEWGLPLEYKENKQPKKLWLPHGIVIPTFLNDKTVKLKIRRHDWLQGDLLPKYVEIVGSKKAPSLFGDVETNIAVVIESELDGMLLDQEAGKLCFSIALGGAGKKADLQTHHLLLKGKGILFALDFDETGKKAFNLWRQTYPNLRAWPAPYFKSLGDAFVQGIDLKQWVQEGLNYYKF